MSGTLDAAARLNSVAFEQWQAIKNIEQADDMSDLHLSLVICHSGANVSRVRTGGNVTMVMQGINGGFLTSAMERNQ